MQLALDRPAPIGKKTFLILALVELLILVMTLTLPSRVLLPLLAFAVGIPLLFILPICPYILFFALILTTALDVTGILMPNITFLGTSTPLTGFHLVLGAILIFAIANFFYRERTLFPRIELMLPVILYLSVVALSVSYSPNKNEAVVHFLRLLALVLLSFLTVFLVENRKKATFVIVSFILCATGIAALGIFQALSAQYFLPATFVMAVGASISRAAGTFHNPNTFATFLMVAIVLSVSVLLGIKISWQKLAILSAAIVTLLGGLITTFSRANWLATLVAVFFICVFGRRFKLFVAVLLVALCIIIVISLISPNFAELVLGRFTSIFTTFSEFSSAARVSSTSRIQFIKGAWSMFLSHPLLGIGIRGFPVLFDKYKPADFPVWLPTRESHTLHATILAELGLMGFSIYLWFVFVILKVGLKAFKTTDDSYLKAVSLGLLSVFIGFQVSAFF
ncbi:MAG: O-antigen ligase family protein, partial [Candidatus Latescibacteria bacterium]|nr:O-antigen ligase family protein [Candidatus Latescibacterota bacterium]